jgi:hypothetical protein
VRAPLAKRAPSDHRDDRTEKDLDRPLRPIVLRAIAREGKIKVTGGRT